MKPNRFAVSREPKLAVFYTIAITSYICGLLRQYFPSNLILERFSYSLLKYSGQFFGGSLKENLFGWEGQVYSLRDKTDFY